MPIRKKKGSFTIPAEAVSDVYYRGPMHKDNDKESYGRHMNELVRMMNTSVFKELKLSGFAISMSMDRAPRLEIRDGKELVGTVEPVIGGGRTSWVVEKSYSHLKKNDLPIGSFGRSRFGTWDEVEQAIYEVVSNDNKP